MTVVELFENLLKASPTFENAINDDNYDVVGNVLVHILCDVDGGQIAGIPPQESRAMRDVIDASDESLVTKLACALFPDYLDELPRRIVKKVPVCYQAYVAYKRGIKDIDISAIEGTHALYDGMPEMFFDTIKGLKSEGYPVEIDLPNTTAGDVFYEDASIHKLPAIRAKTLHIKITGDAAECKIVQYQSPIADMIEIEGNGFPKSIRVCVGIRSIKAIKFIPTAGCERIMLKDLELDKFTPDFKLYVPEGLKVDAPKMRVESYKKVLVRY